jgi:pSer/pThr/pTyr-binding forkhead associated (FHA) protein
MRMNGYQISVSSGPGRGLTWTIPERPMVIGSDLDCDIVIADQLVSHQHCEIWCLEDGVFVKTLNGCNAILVNGRSIESCELSLGDEVRVGNVSFVLTRPSWAPGTHTDTSC